MRWDMKPHPPYMTWPLRHFGYSKACEMWANFYLQFQGCLFVKSLDMLGICGRIDLFPLDFDHEIDRHVAYCREYMYCFQPIPNRSPFPNFQKLQRHINLEWLNAGKDSHVKPPHYNRLIKETSMFDVFGSFSNKITLVVVSFLDWRTGIASSFMMVHVVDRREHKTLFKKSKSTFHIITFVEQLCDVSMHQSIGVYPCSSHRLQVFLFGHFSCLWENAMAENYFTHSDIFVDEDWNIKNDKFCGHQLLCTLFSAITRHLQKRERTLWNFWFRAKLRSLTGCIDNGKQVCVDSIVPDVWLGLIFSSLSSLGSMVACAKNNPQPQQSRAADTFAPKRTIHTCICACMFVHWIRIACYYIVVHSVLMSLHTESTVFSWRVSTPKSRMRFVRACLHLLIFTVYVCV